MKQRFLIIFGALFLMALLTVACGETTGGTATQVQVTETDYSITSSMTTFSPGTTYHFVITNKGNTTHEFMIMPKSEGSMGGMQMGGMDKIALASISNLNSGETRTLDYTFPASAVGSHPQLACYLPGHYEAGMKQDLTVKA